jgi:hypothetical protein
VFVFKRGFQLIRFMFHSGVNQFSTTLVLAAKKIPCVKLKTTLRIAGCGELPEEE